MCQRDWRQGFVSIRSTKARFSSYSSGGQKVACRPLTTVHAGARGAWRLRGLYLTFAAGVRVCAIAWNESTVPTSTVARRGRALSCRQPVKQSALEATVDRPVNLAMLSATAPLSCRHALAI